MNKKQSIVTWRHWMKRTILYWILFIVIIFSIPCYAEQDGPTIPEEMRPFVEAMQGLVDACMDNYKEMSKYHTPYYAYSN